MSAVSFTVLLSTNIGVEEPVLAPFITSIDWLFELHGDSLALCTGSGPQETNIIEQTLTTSFIIFFAPFEGYTNYKQNTTK